MPLNRLVDSGFVLPPPDVQSTTFSVDALARFSCNTWDEALAAQSGGEFDIIVVGSGMYGAHLAAKLFELGRRMRRQEQAPRILVLESGPFLITEHNQNVTGRSTPLGGLIAADLVSPGQTNTTSLAKHYRCVGGKSLFWGGWAPRYQHEDMARLNEAGERLWPEEIEQYLFRTGYQGGYEHSEREIGAYPVQDFINGDLYVALKQRAQAVVASQRVPLLKQVCEPPIAVQGESPGSGLFSFDKFSSVPALVDSVREDNEIAAGNDARRRLLLVPHTEVLKLETANGRVHQLVAAIGDPSAPDDRAKARVVRLNLKSSAIVVLAGNTINSTRLALNSFPRPAALGENGELMGRNLMYHTRSNYTWRVKRSALALPPPDPANITTAALHITGAAPTADGTGQFHFQFYAAPNMDVPMFPGASRDPERFLYLMAPNIEDLEAIREAQNGLGNDRVVLGIRTVGETFGDRTTPIGNNLGVSWMSVNPFGGSGDDVYNESGNDLRIPKAYVHLATRTQDQAVWTAQDQTAFAFIEALTAQAPAAIEPPPAETPAVEVLATVPENQIPGDDYRVENSPAGRFFIGRFGGKLRVLDATCTHEGCFVNWAGGDKLFRCPCHTATFASDGTNLSGPPPAPLHIPEFRVQDGKLEVIKTEGISAPVEYVGGGPDGIGSTYHESGTLWLGTNPQTSVTDVNGRFHHVTNAYCVDQSLFPTAGSANPVLTGITLTRKIAASIIDRYTSAALTPTEAGFTTLYSGDFAADGWQLAPGSSPHFFDVAHPRHPVLGAGVDTRESSPGVLWYSAEMFRDFVLRLDWLAYDNAANSGILLRMPRPIALDSAFYDSSIEVQIDEHGHDHVRQLHGSPLHKTGAVYDCFPARQWAAKVIQPRNAGKTALWNSCEIRLQGARIQVRLNGAVVSQGEFSNLIAPSATAAGKTKREAGFLGLQCHTEVVQFRNIRIQKL